MQEMKQYIGTKQLKATPMTLGAYNNHRGWTIPANENPERDGYLVEYEDEYQSWSPKEVFEAAYRQTNGLNFGLALEALKIGKKVARTGWNGKGMYLWLLPAANVKREWVKDPMLLSVFGDRDELHCLGSIRMLTATGEVLTGWLASQSDMLADDWQIVE
jgi:hypothetical protein